MILKDDGGILIKLILTINFLLELLDNVFKSLIVNIVSIPLGYFMVFELHTEFHYSYFIYNKSTTHIG
jgi:hypothetical protein